MTSYEKEMILSFKRGAVSLCIASETGTNIAASLEIAEHVAKVAGRGRVLYINTVQTERQLGSEIRKHVNKEYSSEKPDPRITYLTSPPGVLDEMGKSVHRILESGVRYVIINALEFSAKDHRRRNELLFQIMGWTNIFGAAVLIFCEETKTDPVSGKIHRASGGVGKLAVIAKNVFHIATPADKQETVSFEQSMSIYNSDSDDEDEDFKELDENIAEMTDDEITDDIPQWKPANLQEEKEVYAAYMKNHPELVFDESVILGNRRDYVMHLVAEEKKKQAKREAGRATSIRMNLPDQEPISSEAAISEDEEVFEENPETSTDDWSDVEEMKPRARAKLL